MNFYNKFLDLCIARGIAPSAAAEGAGLSRSQVSRWKNGKGFTDVSAMKLARFFDVEDDYFLTEEKEKSPSEEDELNELLQALRDREDLRAMLAVGRHNSPDQVRKLTALMETMQEG